MDSQITRLRSLFDWLRALFELLVLVILITILLPLLTVLFIVALFHLRRLKWRNYQPSLRILGVQVWNTTIDDAVAHIVRVICGEGQPQPLFFVNAACFNIAAEDPEYQAILNGPGSVLLDGVGVKLAGMFTNQLVRENVNGTDLFPKLCETLENHRIRGEDYGRIYLLGACEESVQGTANWILEKYPDVQVVGARSGFYQSEEIEPLLQDIRQSQADLLLVAMGVPRQEKWIHEHLPKIGVQVAIGVGGLFDFYSGRMPRAPLFVRKLGFEWLYRLLQEPRRMAKRYLIGNATFLWKVFRYGTEYPGEEISPIEYYEEEAQGREFQREPTPVVVEKGGEKKGEEKEEAQEPEMVEV